MIRRLTRKLLGQRNNVGGSWVAILTLRSRNSAAGGRTDVSNDRHIDQDAIELIPKTSSVEERLNNPDVSNFRIISSNIKLTSSYSHGSGGKPSVAQAKFKRGRWSNEKLVAVKTLRGTDELIHEVEVMMKLKHKNIAELIGFVEDLEKGMAWIVLSWESNENVRDFLAKADRTISQRISLIQDTFEGLRYLHTRQPPVCHGDLKSLNILVNSSYHAILTDFSSARAVIKSEDGVVGDDDIQYICEATSTEGACPSIHVSASGNQLTLTGLASSICWVPPEVSNGKQPGLPSDIWAAGWVCWELMTNIIPFPELELSGETAMMTLQVQIASSSEEAQMVPIIALCSLMEDCWAFNPRARPDIYQCFNELEWMPFEPLSDHGAPSVRLLLQMGQVQFKHARYEEAASLYQRALSLATYEGNQTGAAAAFMFLGDAYRFQTKWAEAEELYTQSHEVYTRIGHALGRANTLDGLGHLNCSLSRYSKATQSFTRAQEIYSHIGDGIARANTLAALGGLNCLQSKYSQAEASFISALEIYRQFSNDRGLATTLRGLGEVYLAQSKYPEAEEVYTRAQEAYTRIGDDQGRANTFYELGRISRYQSKYPEAEELYTRSERIYANVGCVLGRANALFGLGDLQLFQSQYAQAEDCFIRAQEIYTSGAGCHPLGQANILYAMGIVRHSQGRSAEAATYYVEARNLYTHLGRTEISERVSHRLVDVLPDENSSTTSLHRPVVSDNLPTGL